jgi:tryptophan-rich sensory protein
VNSRGSAWLRPVLVAAAAAIAVAGVGGTLTDLGPWYRSLVTPSWQPPDPAFGVIWTVVFACAAASGVTAWRRLRSSGDREAMIGLFAVNGFLNVLWSLLFFRLHRPDWALIEVAAFWLSIAILIIFQARVSRVAAALLAPYLIWVSIASVLNYEIVQLNGPFARQLQ